MSVKSLDHYDVRADRGFLCDFDPCTAELPAHALPAAELAADLPARVVAGRVRRDIEALPDVPLEALAGITSDAVVRTSLVHYSFLGQAYVWCEEPVPQKLPQTIARPLWVLAERQQQPPILTYSQYVLDNWSLIDPGGPVDLTNIRMVQPFAGGVDEAWFVTVHVAIEAAAGRMLARIPETVAAADRHDADCLTIELEAMIGVWDVMLAAFDRMTERCDPYVYFNRVRPWIHGFKDNPALPDGIEYEGVAATHGKPQTFRGQTGSQSSIVPVMDALLSVGHSHDPLRGYLDELHEYRPLPHRRFIDDVRNASRVRDTVKAIRQQRLTAAYNECLDRLTRFRTRHLEYAGSYINKQARGSAGNATDIGTGGTPFMKYLKKHRDEAGAHRL